MAKTTLMAVAEIVEVGFCWEWGWVLMGTEDGQMWGRGVGEKVINVGKIKEERL